MVTPEVHDAIAFPLYFVVLEARWGKTLGKVLTKTRVVRVDGGKPRFGQIVVRLLVRLIPLEWFSILWDDRCWHDRWSGTRVVRTKAPKWKLEASRE